MESLATAGAFDRYNPNRAAMLAMVEPLMKYAAAHVEERNSAQVNLFGGAQDSIREPEMPKADKWEPLEQLRHEFDAVGFYLSAHPLDNMTTQLDRLRVIPSSKVREALISSPTNRLRMAGIVVRKQERTSQKGNRFAFATISDPYGVFEMMIFSDLLNASRDLLEAGTPILLSIDVDSKPDSDELRYLAQSIEPLTAAVQTVTRLVTMQVAAPEAVAKVKSILTESGQGRVKVQMMIDAGKNREVVMELPGGFTIQEDTAKKLRGISGVTTVKEI
jgi:DNA polymerase-3 subunit alpha